MKCQLKSFIRFLKEGKKQNIENTIFCFFSISDAEFDKRQEEFDKMIERQPLAVRENDFEYQVKNFSINKLKSFSIRFSFIV